MWTPGQVYFLTGELLVIWTLIHINLHTFELLAAWTSVTLNFYTIELWTFWTLWGWTSIQINLETFITFTSELQYNYTSVHMNFQTNINLYLVPISNLFYDYICMSYIYPLMPMMLEKYYLIRFQFVSEPSCYTLWQNPNIVRTDVPIKTVGTAGYRVP